MARIRTIKPEFWANEGLSSVSLESHFLAAALLNYADDEGYFHANPILVAAACCPLRQLDVNVALQQLHSIDYIRLGTGQRGILYGRVVNFRDHQRVQHPTPSKIALLSIDWGTHEALMNHSREIREPLTPEWKGKEGKGTEQGKEGKGSGEGEPTAEQLMSAAPGLDLAAWTMWLAYRRGIKRRLRAVSMLSAARQMAALGARQAEAVEYTKANGWTGLRLPEGPPPKPRLVAVRTADQIEADYRARGLDPYALEPRK